MIQSDLQPVVFKRTSEWDFDLITFSPRNLQVLACIDGGTSIAEIGEELCLTVEEIREDINFLQSLNIVTIESEPLSNETDSIIDPKRHEYIVDRSSRVL